MVIYFHQELVSLKGFESSLKNVSPCLHKAVRILMQFWMHDLFIELGGNSQYRWLRQFPWNFKEITIFL